MPFDVSLTLRVNVIGECLSHRHGGLLGVGGGEEASGNITWVVCGGKYKEKHHLVDHLAKHGAAFQLSGLAKL